MLDKLETIRDKCAALSIACGKDLLYVSIPQQRLFHFRDALLHAEYAISTSRKPPSCVENSLGTPSGLHRIAEKIGDGAPLGMIFKGRKPTGCCYQDMPEEERTDNLITTRILWLEGLENGINRGEGCDTHARYIYIHGTNQESKLGSPNSHGCVLLANKEMLNLFNDVPSGTPVYIQSS